MSRFSLDSNILVYAADARDPVRQASAMSLIGRAPYSDCVLTPQSLAEFFNAVTRKGIIPRAEAAAQIGRWRRVFQICAGPTGDAVYDAALASAAGRFQFYDALLLATASAAGCVALVSEDMADGARFAGVRVVSAFDPAGGIAGGALALLT
jgi:predicted nucleic acid-binding protein